MVLEFLNLWININPAYKVKHQLNENDSKLALNTFICLKG